MIAREKLLDQIQSANDRVEAIPLITLAETDSLFDGN